MHDSSDGRGVHGESDPGLAPMKGRLSQVDVTSWYRESPPQLKRGGVRACVRKSAVPTGLGSIFHFTQHSACGCVLG